MTNDEILDIRRRALDEAATIAESYADDYRKMAVELHKRSAKQVAIYGADSDAADQTKISAQVLDACAEEARVIAARIRAQSPQRVSA